MNWRHEHEDGKPRYVAYDESGRALATIIGDRTLWLAELTDLGVDIAGRHHMFTSKNLGEVKRAVESALS